MINDYIQFISDNDKGLQSLEKIIEVFEYLKNCISQMVLCFFKRRTRRMSLKGIFFSHTDMETLAQWLLVS